MAKKGTKVADLYLQLGLNLDDLQLEFDAAGQTVSQAISRLNSEAKQIRIKTEIDMAKLDTAADAFEKAKIEIRGMNSELTVQQQKLQLLAAARNSAIKTYGQESAIARKAQTNYLQQQLAVEKLAAKLRDAKKASDDLGKSAQQNMKKMQEAAGGTSFKVSNLAAGFSKVHAAAAAAAAAVTAVAGTAATLADLASKAADYDENIAKTAKRLGVTLDDVRQTSAIFRMSGKDMDEMMPLFTRLNQQILSAGKNGNALTRSMNKFGFSLTDTTGKLLPMNEQLAELVKGYERALEAGDATEFITNVLGPRGASLIPVLEEFRGLVEDFSEIKIADALDPDTAENFNRELRKTNEQWNEMKLALGRELMPLAIELFPKIREKVGEVVEYLNNHGDEVRATLKAWFDIAKKLTEAMIELAKIANKLNLINPGGISGGAFIDVTRHINKANEAAEWYIEHIIKDEDKKQRARQMMQDSALARYQIGANALFFHDAEKRMAQRREEKRQQEQNELKQRQAAQAAAKQAANMERAKAQALAGIDDLREALYQYEHTALEVALHTADREAAEAKKKYEENYGSLPDEANALITQELETKKAKIRLDFENETASKIDSIHKTALEQRLDEIDREAEAWKKKGLDEVRATEWAEKSKLDAKRNAMLEVLKSEREQFKIWQQQGTRGLVEHLRKKYGVTQEDMMITPEQLAAYQKSLKTATENILPNFAPDGGAEFGRTMGKGFLEVIRGTQLHFDALPALGAGVQMLRGTQSEYAYPDPSLNRFHAPESSVNVNINFNDAVVDNEARVSELAERVSGVIIDRVQGGWSSYGG